VLADPNRELLVPERDVDALVEAFGKLLALDWQPIVAANRRRIEELHDRRVQALALARLYADIAPA
jgi:glycosyltransferase involved in cell wall biosynthesis